MRAASSFYVLALLASATSTFAAPIGPVPGDVVTVDTDKSANVGVLDTTCAQCAGKPNDQSLDTPAVGTVDTDKTGDVKVLDNQVLPLVPADNNDASSPPPLFKDLGPVASAIVAPISSDSTEPGTPFELLGAIYSLLGEGSEALSDDDKNAIIKAIRAYLANGGAYPADDELATMPLQVRKAIARFARGGHELISQPADTTPDSSSSSFSSIPDVAIKPLSKFVIRPLRAQEDQIPAGTMACPNQDPAAPIAIHAEDLIPGTLSICLDTTVSFVTPANAAVCPEDREVFLGVHAKSQIGNGLPGDGSPIVRLCEEVAVLP